jgi:hypothetical protein
MTEHPPRQCRFCWRPATAEGDGIYCSECVAWQYGDSPAPWIRPEPRVLNYKTDGLPEGAVYIGRRMPQYGLPQSPWANAFKIDTPKQKRDGTRDEVLAKYERWLLSQPELLARLPELRHRDLVCWCAPEPCHGHVLMRLINNMEEAA